MLFTSPIFLFLFLPIVVTLYFIIPQRFKNLYLLIASLFFYIWGERKYAIVIFASIFFNHFAALAIGYFDRRKRLNARKITFILALLFNLGLLGVIKYSGFVLTNVNEFLTLMKLHLVPVPEIRLTLGISFFTFQGLSYIIDVYRRTTQPTTNIVTSALYISFFPQLIAGPIVRYHDIEKQLLKRKVTIEAFSYGVQRFILGVGKKVLIANQMAVVADEIFNTPTTLLSMEVAWLGAVAYALQIYFDFSAYSDMAIGLARMFGFTFLENFNYPYISKSITEFWRRWHISLTNWFKDYVYIPLGGNREGLLKTCVNILIVFILSGLWHGASWNFVVWGALYGIILVLERVWLLDVLKRLPTVFQHVYSISIIVCLWVVFRTYDLVQAQSYLKALFSFGHSSQSILTLSDFLNIESAGILMFALLFSIPIKTIVLSRIGTRLRAHSFLMPTLRFTYIGILILVFILSSMSLASGAYNPFIYFRF